MQLTNNFLTLTGLVVAADIGENLEDIRSKLSGNVVGNDLHPSAGITRNQIRDRWVKDTGSGFFLIPPQGSGSLQTPTAVAFPSAMTAGPRIRRKLKAGEFEYLASLEIHVIDTSGSGGAPYPRIQLYKNGTLVPGATFDLTDDDDYYFMENDDPLNNPFLTFGPDDRWELYYGSSTGAGNPTALGVFINPTFKSLLMS